MILDTQRELLKPSNYSRRTAHFLRTQNLICCYDDNIFKSSTAFPFLYTFHFIYCIDNNFVLYQDDTMYVMKAIHRIPSGFLKEVPFTLYFSILSVFLTTTTPEDTTGQCGFSYFIFKKLYTFYVGC